MDFSARNYLAARWLFVLVVGLVGLVGVLSISAVAAANSFTGNIFTVAGGGAGDGNGGPATAAQLDFPGGVAVLPDGGFLVADSGNDRVVRVGVDGVIRRVAGAVDANGRPVGGFRGEDGPATAAQLNSPGGVAVLPDGGFLVADTGNHRVMRVGVDGVIRRVAGAVDVNGNPVRGFRGEDGPATAAQLYFPGGVAVLPDGGFLVADSGNHRVMRVGVDGVIRRVAGAVDVNGNPVRGFRGEGGQATAAQLHDPGGVAVLPDGGFLVAESFSQRVMRVGVDGVIRRVAGTVDANGDPVGGFGGEGGPATAAQLAIPRGVAVSVDGRLLVADSDNNRVRLVDIDLRLRPSLLRSDFSDPVSVLRRGGVASLAGGSGKRGFGGDGGFASGGLLNHPGGVSVVPERRLRLAGLPAGHDMGEEGSVLVADTLNHRVRKLTPDGRIWTVAGTGAAGFLVRDAQGELRSGDGLLATQAELNNPTDVDATDDGGFLIADQGNHRIRKVNADGVISTVAGSGKLGFNGDFDKRGERRLAVKARLNHPEGVFALPHDKFLVADTGNHVIREVTEGKGIRTIVGKPGESDLREDPAVLQLPARITQVEGGDLLVSTSFWVFRWDKQTDTLKRVAGPSPQQDDLLPEYQQGDEKRPATEVGASNPMGILATKDGFIFADSGNDRIRRVKHGLIRTIAGNGSNGLTGDFGPAKRAGLDRPADIDYLPDGLVVADTDNNAIRFINKRYDR